MKVQNMKGRTGRPVANQFIIEGEELLAMDDTGCLDDPVNSYDVRYFQSYDSVIVRIIYGMARVRLNVFDYKYKNTVYLDKNKWDYSTTTGKYRNQFLGEGKKETQAKIDSGEYILTDLN